MPYLVKAVSTSGVVTWVSEPGLDGVRCISLRERAEIFRSSEDANGAICDMPDAFARCGIKFSLVETD
jgi:hypothetical protein